MQRLHPAQALELKLELEVLLKRRLHPAIELARHVRLRPLPALDQAFILRTAWLLLMTN